MPANRTLPINSQTAQNNSQLTKALTVITMGIRIGDQNKTVGYIQELDRTHSRTNTHLKQIEPFPNGTFGGKSGAMDFNNSSYFPGETVEVVPGILGEEMIKINRVALLTSTMFEAFMRAGGGGTKEDGTPSNVNNVEQTSRYVSLLQQIRPIDVFELYISPIDYTVVWGIKYEECWFKSMNRTVRVNDSSIIETADLDVTRTRQFVG